MREDIRSRDIAPPLISAPEQPVKRRPDQPGGLDIPNRDRAVFDLLAEPLREEGGGSDSAEVLQKAAVNVEETGPLEKVEPEKKVDVPVAADLQTPKTLEKTPVQVSPSPETVSPKQARPEAGKWGVQLASFVNQADAERAQKSYQERYVSLLGELFPAIQNVTLSEGRGERYRVQFFGLPHKQAALSLCRRLKKQNQGCLHVKR